MIQEKEKRYYFAVTRLSALLRRITSIANGDFYCLNCLHSFRTKIKLESRKKVCEYKDFGGGVMPPEDAKILKFTQHHKTINTPATVYTYLECIVKTKKWM